MSILDYYVKSIPSEQNALDIFKGEWSSSLPPEKGLQTGGVAALFQDGRVKWAVEQFGGVEGQTILELGPLEGAHTYMLEKMGAASVTAIEANTRAYLKCLIIKEVMGLAKAHFLCGDFVEYLRTTQERVDLCVASGVLYHMVNPVELLSLITRVSDRIYLWTHYYDAELISKNPNKITPKFPGYTESEYEGFKHTLYRYEYLSALSWSGFCGGSADFSHWLSRDEILGCLKHFGFGEFKTIDYPDHPNGPAFSLTACRLL